MIATEWLALLLKHQFHPLAPRDLDKSRLVGAFDYFAIRLRRQAE
jgi:hypothetical protein